MRHYPGAVLNTTVPTAEPLTGRWVRLDLLTEADLDEMYPILSDPAVYAQPTGRTRSQAITGEVPSRPAPRPVAAVDRQET